MIKVASLNCEIVNADSIWRLRKALQKAGYLTIASSANPLFPWSRDLSVLDRIRDTQLRACVDLFLLGKTICIDNLDSEIRNLVPNLLRLGLLSQVDRSQVNCGGLMLSSSMGIMLFHQRPDPRIMLYFGPESFALAWRLEVNPDDDVLDLCSGPGYQALVAARQARSVTAVELNPVAANLLEINKCLNGISNIEVVCSDLVDVELNKRFNLVTANPPLHPVPPGLQYVLPGHGGSDGLAITRNILQRLHKWLSPEGRLQFIGFNYLHSAGKALPVDLTEACSVPMALDLTIVGRYDCRPGTPVYQNLLDSLYLSNKFTRDEVNEALSKYISSLPVAQVVSFLVRGNRAQKRHARVTDFGPTSLGGWFV